MACVEAYPFNYGTQASTDNPLKDVGFSQWEQATQLLLQENPGWTGMGKLTHDVRLATDLLLAQPGLDESRVLCIGHSLGGKM